MHHQLVVDKGSNQGTESALNDLRGGSGRRGQRTDPGDHLVAQVVDVLRETGLPAERLTLEMTESVLLDKG
jgi:hypothetical protein